MNYRHPTLSEKPNAPRLLPSLSFELDLDQNIGVLLDASMPGNRYEFLSVVAMTISMSNSDAVREAAKQSKANVNISLDLHYKYWILF